MHDKQVWENNDIQYMFHEHICEYDMEAASLSIAKRFQLLDNDLITQLNLMKKEDRVVKIGLIQREDKDFSQSLLSGIRDIRQKFIIQNNLSTDDIIALHSDAVFMRTHNKVITDIEGVNFRKKGEWTSFMRFKNINMYYMNDYIKYQNINQTMLMEQTMGINLHIKKVFRMIEDYDEDIFNYLSKFQMQYLQDKLPQQYYVPFGRVGADYKAYNLQLLAFLANVVIEETRHWKGEQNV